jgi:hypothetical protein
MVSSCALVEIDMGSVMDSSFVYQIANFSSGLRVAPNEVLNPEPLRIEIMFVSLHSVVCLRCASITSFTISSVPTFFFRYF